MDFKDYYKILGVERSAAQDAIKKSFRRLAAKYHPDKNPGSKAAEDKFKEINEAYEVLGDPENRKKYDLLGADWKNAQNAGGPSGFDWSRWQSQGPYRRRSASSRDFENMFGEAGGPGGAGGFSDFFGAIFGGKGMGGMSPGASYGGRYGMPGAGVARGRDIETEMAISLEEAYEGATRIVDLGDQKLRLKLKPGLADDQVIKLAGKGDKGRGGGSQGDILIRVKVLPHPVFERIEDDLYLDLPVDIYTAVLGEKVEVPSLKGKVKVTVPERFDDGVVLRLPGLGMPLYDQPGRFGDLFLRLRLKLPEPMQEREIELIREVARVHSAFGASAKG